jgi:hypothetical protein
MVLDEISSIGKILLKFNDLRLRSIKHVHTNFLKILMSLLQVIFIKFNQFCDARVFKINMNNINSLTTNFWMEKIKWYELKQVMCQSDEQFINILNQF